MSGSDFFNHKGIDKRVIPSGVEKPPSPTLVDVDLLLSEVRALLASQPRFKPVLDRLEKASVGLIQAGSRVGTLQAKVTPDGYLEIAFRSRYRITRD